MNAIRRDEEVDNLHSVYVDQWDWEKVIERQDRNEQFLRQTVRAIVGAVVETNVISGTLRVRMDPPATGFKTFHKDECQYLRGGKRAPIAPDPEPEEITE